MAGKEELIYSGIPTFMGGDFIKEKSIKNYDVVFLGVPTDYGASYRLGAKYAPRQLREYSFWDRVDGLPMYDLDNERYIKTNNLKIADIGDIEVSPTNPTENQNNITDMVCKITKNSFPLICGGDHCITYGSFRGCYKALKEQCPDYEIGIIHYDAHMDIEQDYLNMPDVWHGNIFRKLIEDGYLEGKNLYTIGPRGVVNRKWVDYSKENCINLYTSNKVKKDGIENVMEQIAESNKKKKIKFYVTFDIDCIDMSYIFGTGTPQSNGLPVYDCEISLRALRKLDIIGFDLVELNPKLDDSHSSFVIAAELLFHFLAFGFKRRAI
ncbi:MAG: arginase family protein [Candidatus Nomurabacteria bacterium]|jgi:guanidinopropionase|nr:arginase family protein [Candidatus Nomurabacteria bacterium]